MRVCLCTLDECGSLVVAVVLVMLAVSVIGVMSIKSSVVDLKIAGNEKRVRQTFYATEAVAMEGVQRLSDSATVDLGEHYGFWHHRRKHLRDDRIDFRSFASWQVDGHVKDNALKSTMGSNLFMAAVEWRLATGSSALVTGPRLYLNRVYGLCRNQNSRHIVEIGVYQRY